MLRMIAMLGALALAACGSSGGSAPRTGVPGYAGGESSCVPYARARSGIDLQGDAWQWWDAAAQSGRYDLSVPALEAVLAGADDVSQHFADLVDREPELPAHLRSLSK